MTQRGLLGFFESFINKESLFLDKKALTSSYFPETINHRDSEVKKIANVLAPSLRQERPSNIFIYGKSGTGKTLTVKHVTSELQKTAEQNNIPLAVHYLNCKLKKVSDTEYRVMAQLAREMGKDIPPTGLPTDEVYRAFFDVIDKDKKTIILVLDEIDELIRRTGDSILYNLTRINEDLKNAQICIVGISNDMFFLDSLDQRAKSSLSEEETIFAPYNALQLQDILRQRSQKAFKSDAVEPGVIEKCAARAAQDHGDARRAIELLRVAAETAERNGFTKVTLNHINESEERIESERAFETATKQPKQHQVVLYSILAISSKRKSSLFTGEIYELYKGLCIQTGLKALTQRRVSDVIAELDTLGLINTRVISKGRYGRTREITPTLLPILSNKIKKTLEDSLGLLPSSAL